MHIDEHCACGPAVHAIVRLKISHVPILLYTLAHHADNLILNLLRQLPALGLADMPLVRGATERVVCPDTGQGLDVFRPFFGQTIYGDMAKVEAALGLGPPAPPTSSAQPKRRHRDDAPQMHGTRLQQKKQARQTRQCTRTS